MGKFNYYAFISYSTADEKWAKWLHSHLESYSVPASVRKDDLSAPKHIRPVFWYKKDLSGTNLHNALNAELEASKYLIVICSPDSAKSIWVNDEVEYFIQNNRKDKIIPFIVSGSPDNISENSCFCPAIQNLPHQDVLRGINVVEIGKQRALVDVVATILGVRFDTLWKRHHRKQKIYSLLYCACFIFTLLAGYFLWDYNRIIYKFYDNYVDSYGLPKGIMELSEDVVAHRARSYRIAYERTPFGQPNAWSWRISSLSIVNSYGGIIENEYSENVHIFPHTEYKYNKVTGKLSEALLCGRNKNVQYRYVYSPKDNIDACIVDIYGASEDRKSEFAVNHSSSFMANQDVRGVSKANITRYVYIRDENGYIQQKTYHSNNDFDTQRSMVCDAEGIYGVKYEYDSLGLKKSETYIDKELKPCMNADGVSSKEYILPHTIYGQQKVLYKDIKGRLILNKSCCAVCINDLDKFGNVISVKYYGEDKKPCYSNDGYSYVLQERDDHGNEICTAYYDINGERCITKAGHAIQMNKYDHAGRITEVTYYDEKGQKANGNCKIHYKYDSKSNVIETAYYDSKDQLAIDATQYSIERCKYDKNNRLLEKSYYNENDKPVIISDGYFKVSYDYDTNGNIVRESYYNTNNKLCIAYAKYAYTCYDYDDNNNITSISHYDEYGKPVFVGGACRMRFKYNSLGYVIERCSYDESEKLCINSDGYAIKRDTWDERGKIVDVSWYDTNDKPCFFSGGIHKLVVTERNNQGLETEQLAFDTKSCLMENCRSAIVKGKYNKYGKRIEDSYHDKDGNLFTFNGNPAISRYKYDNHFNIVEYAHFDEHENPMLCSSSGNVFAKQRVKFDKNDNAILVEYLDCDGQLLNQNAGYAYYASDYDKYGRKLQTTYYDANKKKCINNELQYSTVRYKYNDLGQLVKECYFDVDGQPIESTYGFAVCKYKYDRGNMVECSFYDIANKPCENDEGYHMRKIKYDQVGNEIEYTFWGTNKKVKKHPDGYAKICHSYDNYKRLISVSCFDTKDNPTEDIDGIFKWTIKYNKRGLETERCLYNKKGKVARQKNGDWAIVTFKYDEYDQLIEEAYLNEKRNPNLTSDGYSKIESEYDERHSLIKKTYYDNDTIVGAQFN